MLDEIKNIIGATKPCHIIKALCSPSHIFRAIKYHYRRVSEPKFIKFLSGQLNCSSSHVEEAYRNFEDHKLLWDEIDNNLSIYPNNYGGQMTRELPCLYLLVRLLKPNRVIETGVSAGVSSAYILRVLKDNGKGKLNSIDLGPDNLPLGKRCGWVVPDELRDSWDLRIGDTKQVLIPLLDEIGGIDFFVQDSEHTYEHMMWEFECIWTYLRQNSLFLAHDVGASDAFFDFMKKVKINWYDWYDYRVFHVLGGFAKR